LFSVATQLHKIGVRLILIQIHEAHSDAWPIGLKNQPKSNMSFQDRVNRAQQFVKEETPPYDVYIDGKDDQYEQKFRAWPDRYYYVDLNDMSIIETSSYGQRDDALIDRDCRELVSELLDMLE